MTPRTRKMLFLLACATAIALPLLYVSLARHTPPTYSSNGRRFTTLERIDASQRGVLFRSTVPDETFGKVAFVPIDRLDGPWAVSPLSCDRVYFQGGRGVCEVVEASLIPPYAYFMFDNHFVATEKKPLAGVPSRARVSPDGRRAALTAFVTGHSYAEGGFSTATTLHDTTTGAALDNLEAYSVTRGGEPFNAMDFNFWGATFARDNNRFFATLRTGGVNYLVEGDVAQRAARVIHQGVECPSLSPDNRRIAFKKRIVGNASVFWQVAILDLATMTETVLDAEKRSVDDQVDWLDDQHVVYHLPKTGGADIWALRTDRPEAPQLLIEGGYSPSVVR